MTTNLLLDDVFLKELYHHKNKEVFAKVIALTKDEDPIEEIQGRISSGGSINIDGTSTMRRSCSLTMIANEMNTDNYYWGLNNKFQLEIGLKVPNEVRNFSPDNGTTYPYVNAPEIIWFPEGIYVITSFSSSQSTNSYTISLQGKDKMCLLNGEVSGSIYSSVDFGKEDYTKYTYTVEDMGISGKNYVANKYYTTATTPGLNDFKIASVNARTYEPNLYFIKQNNNMILSTSEDYDNTQTYYYQVYTLSTAEKYNSANIYYKRNAIKVTKAIPIKTIIKEAVHEYAQEPWGNIVVNDLDTFGLELLTYRGTNPMYLVVSESDDDDIHEVVQMTLYDNTNCYYYNDTLKQWENTVISDSRIKYNPRITLDFSNAPTSGYSKIKFSQDASAPIYSIAKIEYGDTCGYRTTDITYAGDLISAVGESVTSILDKIVAMLGNFEYFYDTDGKFIFRKKQTYLDNSWNNIIEGEEELYTENAAYTSATTWSFEDSLLVSSFSNSPNLSNIKNDFALWGTRKSATGKEIPVHLRYAIDKKPVYYKNFEGAEFYTDKATWKVRYNEILDEELGFIKRANPQELVEPQQNPDGTWTPGWWRVDDWAEYYKKLTGAYPDKQLYHYVSQKYTFNFNLNDLFPEPNHNKMYANGDYTNIRFDNNSNRWSLSYFGTWIPAESGIAIFDVNEDGSLGYFGHTHGANSRCTHLYTSYFVEANKRYHSVSYIYAPTIPTVEYEEIKKERVDNKVVLTDWRELIYQMALDYRAHNHEEDFLIKVRTNNGQDGDNEWLYPTGYTGYEQYYVDVEGFWRQLYYPFGTTYTEGVSTYTYSNDADTKGWNVNVLSNPETINFWFDFLDTDSDINKFSVRTIGDRSKSVNDNTIKAIYFREVPTTIFAENIQTVERQSGYTYLQYGKAMQGLFDISSQGKSAKDVLDDYLYKYAYCIESITMSSIPLYHLEPNTRIFINDKNSGIEGEYLVTRISLPLTFNGTMSISATKAIDRLY